MDNESVRLLIMGALTSGCGVLNWWILSRIAEEFRDEGYEISPKTKRRVAMLFAAVTPTVLYLLSLLLAPEAHYSWAENLGYIFLAFTSSQAVHGEAVLPNGRQYAALRAEEARKDAALRMLELEGRL